MVGLVSAWRDVKGRLSEHLTTMNAFRSSLDIVALVSSDEVYRTTSTSATGASFGLRTSGSGELLSESDSEIPLHSEASSSSASLAALPALALGLLGPSSGVNRASKCL